MAKASDGTGPGKWLDIATGFLADENFNIDIVMGLRRRLPFLGLIRVQELGLSGTLDPNLLEYAADAGLVVLTHDVNTMTKFAYERLDDACPCQEL